MKLVLSILAFQLFSVLSVLAQNVNETNTDPRLWSTIASTAKENGHVIKPAAGKLSVLSVTSDTDQYILIMNSATVPANGAVTLLHPPIHVAAATTTMINFPVPLVATTGIAVCNSNANSFTKTIGAADCIFYARWQ